MESQSRIGLAMDILWVEVHKRLVESVYEQRRKQQTHHVSSIWHCLVTTYIGP